MGISPHMGGWVDQWLGSGQITNLDLKREMVEVLV